MLNFNVKLCFFQGRKVFFVLPNYIIYHQNLYRHDVSEDCESDPCYTENVLTPNLNVIFYGFAPSAGFVCICSVCVVQSLKSLKASHNAALLKVDEVSKHLKEERLKTLELETQIQSRALDQRHAHEVDHIRTQLFIILQQYTAAVQYWNARTDGTMKVIINSVIYNKLTLKILKHFLSDIHSCRTESKTQKRKETCSKTTVISS